jgi:hypothetical protein
LNFTRDCAKFTDLIRVLPEPAPNGSAINCENARPSEISRAELQVWSVDLDNNRVSCTKSRSYRQLVPRAERVRAEPIASEIAEAINAGRDDHRLKWGRDGTVRVVLMKVFPYGSGYMQTIAGRRKRLRETLTRLLAERGWREIRRDVYSREAGE